MNPYHNIIISNRDKENIIPSQIKQWLILSNVVNYVQYEKNPKDVYDLNMKTIDQKNHKKIYKD